MFFLGGNGVYGGFVYIIMLFEFMLFVIVKKCLIVGVGGLGGGVFKYGWKGEDLVV